MMKKFLATMLSLVVIPLILTAQSFEIKPVSADRPADATFRVPYMIKADVPSVLKPSSYQTLGAKYISFKTSSGNDLRGSWMFIEDTEPITYEPKSNTFVVAGRDIIATEEGQPFHLQTGIVYTISSNNNGKTWTTPTEIFRQQSNFDVMPTIAVANPSGSNDPADFSYFVYSRVARAEEGQTSAPFYGAHFIFVSPDGADQIALKGPDLNNPSQRQKWFKTNAVTTSKNDKDYAVLAGQLLPDEGFQGGNYGCAHIDMTDIDVLSSIPNAWAVTKFRQPDNPTSGSHYNNGIYIDNDANGTVYACVANMFVDDPESRVVGFSKSDDNGMTWSEFEKMSPQILSNYAVSQGAYKDSVFIAPYEANAFVVYGTDKFSYFTRLYVNMPYPIEDESHIVEIKYDEGTWSIHKVATLLNPEMAFGRMWAINLQKPQETSTDDELIPFLYDMGYEISAAKTLDGNIIVKWLDHRNDVVEFPTTQLALRQPTAVDRYAFGVFNWDSLPSNDVFISYRNTTSSQWSAPANVTNDVRYNRNTIMPRLVKDIHNIPILHLRMDEETLKRKSSLTGEPVNPQYVDFDPFLCELVNEINEFYYLEVAMVDPTATSVDDVAATNNSIAVFPNPVSNVANFSYTLENAGNAIVRISNAMGQTVAEAVNAYLEAGSYNASFDASNLANGTYYITLTVNGKSVTKVMNITK